jgi:hypothetical protein
MKRFVSSGVVFAAALSAASAFAQVTSKPGADALAYDKAVARVWGQVESTNNAVEWCTKNVRSSKAAVQKAYREWNTRFAPVIADIDQRIDEVMNPGGQLSAVEFAKNKAELRQRSAQKYAERMAAGAAEEAKRECAQLPEYFGTRSFDLEVLFVSELALIRARPLPAPPPVK